MGLRVETEKWDKNADSGIERGKVGLFIGNSMGWGIPCGLQVRVLVLGSPVQSGFLSIFEQTETETGLHLLNYSKNRTGTVKDWSTMVLCGCKTGLDQLRFRPVCNRSQTCLGGGYS